MNPIEAQLKHHITKLCQTIGPRPLGSPANHTATQYAAGILENLGLAVTLQEFPCIDWHSSGGKLTINSQQIDITVSDYSLPVNTTAKLAFIKTIDELKTANLSGKICVMHGELCQEPLMPKNMIFWNPEHHQTIIRELETKNPLAILTINDTAAIIADGDFNIPCAAIAAKHLNQLLQTTAAVHLEINAERRPSTAANIIATYGTGAKKIALSAHIDTNANTPGALDNAGGVAILLTLAERLTTLNPHHTIELVIFNGEDYYSTPGEVAYLHSYLQTPENYRCAINIDGAGMQASPTAYSFYNCPETITNTIKQAAATSTAITENEPWPMGDHMVYAQSGIPAIAITSARIFELMNTTLHTPQDNITRLDFAQLINTVNVLATAISLIK